MRRRTLSRSIVEPVDEYLDSLGYFRKRIPRESSCMYRALAEQICLSQSYYEDLRNMAMTFIIVHKNFFQQHLAEPVEAYVQRKKCGSEWAGSLELLALALIFKFDVLAFTDVGASEVNLTRFNFIKVIHVYKDQTDHFDIVYTLERGRVAGFCQYLVYDMLYSKVFKMNNVEGIVDSMLHSCRKESVNSDREYADIAKIVDHCHGTPNSFLDNSMDSLCASPITEKGLTPPFPYRVAKALDPDIYRNSEFDTWVSVKREARFGPYDSRGIQIGAKVQVISGSPYEQNWHGHIQSMTENQGPVEVFVEELGRRVVFPYNSVEKIPSSPVVKAFPDKEPFFEPPAYRMRSKSAGYAALPGPDYKSPNRGSGKVKASPLPLALNPSKKEIQVKKKPSDIDTIISTREDTVAVMPPIIPQTPVPIEAFPHTEVFPMSPVVFIPPHQAVESAPVCGMSPSDTVYYDYVPVNFMPVEYLVPFPEQAVVPFPEQAIVPFPEQSVVPLSEQAVIPYPEQTMFPFPAVPYTVMPEPYVPLAHNPMQRF